MPGSSLRAERHIMARDLPGCVGRRCPCSQTPAPTHDSILSEQYGKLGDQVCHEGQFRDARHMYERQIEALERLHGKESLELVPALLNAADACRSYAAARRLPTSWRPLAQPEKNLSSRAMPSQRARELRAPAARQRSALPGRPDGRSRPRHAPPTLPQRRCLTERF